MLKRISVDLGKLKLSFEVFEMGVGQNYNVNIINRQSAYPRSSEYISLGKNLRLLNVEVPSEDTATDLGRNIRADYRVCTFLIWLIREGKGTIFRGKDNQTVDLSKDQSIEWLARYGYLRKPINKARSNQFVQIAVRTRTELLQDDVSYRIIEGN